MSDDVLRDPNLKVSEQRRLLKSMFSSTTSTDEYEERVIRLFGLQSFTLFGLDQLVVQLAREFINVSERNESKRLLNSYFAVDIHSSLLIENYKLTASEQIRSQSNLTFENIPLEIICDGQNLSVFLPA